MISLGKPRSRRSAAFRKSLISQARQRGANFPNFAQQHRLSEGRYYGVMKCCNLPNCTSFYKYPDTQFRVGWKLFAVGSYKAAKFIGHMRDRDVGRDKSDLY